MEVDHTKDCPELITEFLKKPSGVVNVHPMMKTYQADRGVFVHIAHDCGHTTRISTGLRFLAKINRATYWR